jgi:hypothetical protein
LRFDPYRHAGAATTLYPNNKIYTGEAFMPFVTMRIRAAGSL